MSFLLFLLQQYNETVRLMRFQSIKSSTSLKLTYTHDLIKTQTIKQKKNAGLN